MTVELVNCPLCGGDGRLCTFDGGSPDVVPCNACQGRKKVSQTEANSIAAFIAARNAKRPSEPSKPIKCWPVATYKS